MKIVFSNENTRKVFADRDIHEFSQLIKRIHSSRAVLSLAAS